MTKEKILIEKYSAKVLNWEKAFAQNPTLIEAAYEAMEEYRNQNNAVKTIRIETPLKLVLETDCVSYIPNKGSILDIDGKRYQVGNIVFHWTGKLARVLVSEC